MLKDFYRSALFPSEIKAMLKIKMEGQKFAPSKLSLEELAQVNTDKEFCYSALNKVSRSFAMVIQQLPEDLKDAVCIFYLVLRALDTVEDDMKFPESEKWPLLREFYKKSYDETFKLTGVGDQDDYTILLENYPKVTRVFKSLHPSYQHVIADICYKMGNGMADFSEKKVHSIEDYDLYCYYVAGLVGIGLSGLFSASGAETPTLKDEHKLSNSMGLLLQKTNIIRDYCEDLHGDRVFWPSDVWKKYSEELDFFHKNPNHPKSVACLNHLVTDALRHVPDALAYMASLRNKKIFRFCAIPQVMAIATLSKVYNNPMVFISNVKIRKGLAAKLMVETHTMDDVYEYFDQFAREILRKLPANDPNYHQTKAQLELIFTTIDEPNTIETKFLEKRDKVEI
jgi:farnesyl-diphosphate farnesyltransferase